MIYTYQSVTWPVIDAIETMAREFDDSSSDSPALQAIATDLYFAWVDLVGDSADPRDCARIKGALRAMRTQSDTTLRSIKSSATYRPAASTATFNASYSPTQALRPQSA